MSSTATPLRHPVMRGGPAGWIGAGLRAAAHGLSFGALLLAGTGLLLALAAPVLLSVGAADRLLSHHPNTNALTVTPGGLPHVPSPGQVTVAAVVLAVLVVVAGMSVSVYLLPRILLAMRRLAGLTRRLVGEWCGVPIADPYLPPPGTRGERIRFRRRLGWLLADPATARDVLWVTVNACLGWVLVLMPAGLVLYGVSALGAQISGARRPGLSVLLEVTAVAFGVLAGPWLLRAYGLAARWMLAPTAQAELALRVHHLAQTRSETIDSGSAEMRRIERDLHDGAQARLVAMGMTLDAAGQLVDTNPAAARALLLEARDASAKALAELRDLVRGIHPPVLADRGLADAIRALALDGPLRARLAADLPGRLPAPVESAAYFAVSELLANVSKHARASQAWIDVRHADGMLRIGVSDDGRGGADPARGTGLRGVERRLAAFDGVLAVSSPPGGPTAVTMEIPCALSSLKISSC
jgi:signal transduction histidine kinase